MVGSKGGHPLGEIGRNLPCLHYSDKPGRVCIVECSTDITCQED